MVLTFRSTTPESRTIVEREADGRQRVAYAKRNPAGTRLWDLVVEHPSGETWSGSFTGTDVVGALNEMLNKSENAWRSDRARGDRPPSSMQPDRNRAVTDGDAVAPIRPLPGRQT
jgi:hypothetical protein